MVVRGLRRAIEPQGHPHTAREDGTAQRLLTHCTLADDRRSAWDIGVICHPFALLPPIALNPKAQFFEDAY